MSSIYRNSVRVPRMTIRHHSMKWNGLSNYDSLLSDCVLCNNSTEYPTAILAISRHNFDRSSELNSMWDSSLIAILRQSGRFHIERVRLHWKCASQCAELRGSWRNGCHKLWPRSRIYQWSLPSAVSWLSFVSLIMMNKGL